MSQSYVKIDAEIIDAFKRTGDGWEARINDTLKHHVTPQILVVDEEGLNTIKRESPKLVYLTKVIVMVRDDGSYVLGRCRTRSIGEVLTQKQVDELVRDNPPIGTVKIYK